MHDIQQLIQNNRKWVTECVTQDPDYFKRTASIQTPEYFWIGCSDSRIPANQVIGLQPGEVFVQRNVANLVINTDLNLLTALDYAVVVLNITKVIVCGHYGCGGILASMEHKQMGLADTWLRNIRDVSLTYAEELNSIADFSQRYKRLVEINVIQQVKNVAHTTCVQNAWAQGKELSIHGVIYDLTTGLLHDLNCEINNITQVEPTHRIR